MNLTANSILHELRTYYPLPKIAKTGNTLTIGRPVFLSGQKEWPEGHVCLCSEISEILRDQPLPDNILVFCIFSEAAEKQGRPFLPDNRRVFGLPENTSMPELFNHLQDLFDRYDTWDEHLRVLLKQTENISSMLDLSVPIFGNPLILQAADFFILAHSSDIDENPEMHHLIDAVDSFDTMTTSKLDPFYNEARTYKEPFFLPAYLSGTRELCINLFRHGVFSYRLILAEETGSLTEEAAPYLAHLASYIDLAMLSGNSSRQEEGMTLDRVLGAIIDEKIVDPSIVSNQLSEYGWMSSHTYCCMTLKMTSLDSQNLTSNYLCHHFEEIVPGSCAFQYQDELAVFINLTRFEGTLDQLLNSTTLFLRDSFLKTGISNAIQGTADLRYCYLQASIALETGSKYQNYRWVHRFDDIAVSYLCDCCIRELPSRMVCSREILALKEYDARHHSQYFETLKVYLETRLNAVQASRKLYIHRSTFLYRLERIRDIVNIDFDDQNVLFRLELSYHIMDLQNIDLTEPLP